MVGRQELQWLREWSEADLGAGFDIRSFHDVVLKYGPLRVVVLDSMIKNWAG